MSHVQAVGCSLRHPATNSGDPSQPTITTPQQVSTCQMPCLSTASRRYENAMLQNEALDVYTDDLQVPLPFHSFMPHV